MHGVCRLPVKQSELGATPSDGAIFHGAFSVAAAHESVKLEGPGQHRNVTPFSPLSLNANSITPGLPIGTSGDCTHQPVAPASDANLLAFGVTRNSALSESAVHRRFGEGQPISCPAGVRDSMAVFETVGQGAIPWRDTPFPSLAQEQSTRPIIARRWRTTSRKDHRCLAHAVEPPPEARNNRMQTPEQRPRAARTKVMHFASNEEKSGQYRRGAPISWATSLKVKRPALTRINAEHYRGGPPFSMNR